MKLGLGPIRVCTTAGQSVTPPDPKLLPEQPCDPGVRELIGSLLFLSRCTRFDISFVIARLPKEIRHILRFVAHTAKWSLKSAVDDWEELRLSTFCDESFGTRCFGGYKVKLTGSRGSSFLIEWASRLQGPQSTSSTESESVEWGRAAKAILPSQKSTGCLSSETSALRSLRGQRCIALGSAKRLVSEARASPSPCRNVFSVNGTASKFAAPGEHNRKRGRHHDQGSLDDATPRTLQNRFGPGWSARGEHHDSHSSMSTHWMEESGRAGRGLLVLVRNRTAAHQTDLHVEVRRMFLLTTGSDFFESSSPVVRKGGARETWHQLSLRTEPRTVKYNVVKCPARQRVNLKTRHLRVWERFSCFVRKAAANMD